MTTTAEGVETKEQLEVLQRTECAEVQGFLFDYPRSAADIRYWFLPEANWIGGVRDQAGQPAFALEVEANDKIWEQRCLQSHRLHTEALSNHD